MSSHYSRQQKPRKSGGVPTQHIKTGFTAFQKSIALIGSILVLLWRLLPLLELYNQLQIQKLTIHQKNLAIPLSRLSRKTPPKEIRPIRTHQKIAMILKQIYHHLLPFLLTTIQLLQHLILLQQLKEHNFPMQQELKMPILAFLPILKNFDMTY